MNEKNVNQNNKDFSIQQTAGNNVATVRRLVDSVISDCRLLLENNEFLCRYCVEMEESAGNSEMLADYRNMLEKEQQSANDIISCCERVLSLNDFDPVKTYSNIAEALLHSKTLSDNYSEYYDIFPEIANGQDESSPSGLNSPLEDVHFDSQERIDLISRTCYRILGYITNGCELKKYEQNDIHPQKVDLSSLVKKACDAFSIRVPRCTVNKDIAESVFCECDPERFMAVLLNLIVDACLEADHDEGSIGIKLEKKDSYAVVSVEDNGYDIGVQNIDDLIRKKPCGGYDILKNFCEYHEVPKPVIVYNGNEYVNIISFRLDL